MSSICCSHCLQVLKAFLKKLGVLLISLMIMQIMNCQDQEYQGQSLKPSQPETSITLLLITSAIAERQHMRWHSIRVWVPVQVLAWRLRDIIMNLMITHFIMSISPLRPTQQTQEQHLLFMKNHHYWHTMYELKLISSINCFMTYCSL